MTEKAPRLVRSYGRRRGRKLRAGQERMVAELLPRVALDPGDCAPIDVATLFTFRPRALWLEIGFGAGEHLIRQATRHREIGFIGCEPFLNGIVALLTAMQVNTLTNIRVWTEDARRLLPRLPAASVDRVFILYPDPWPKARHHKRRIIQSDFLDLLAQVIAPGSELVLATDHADYLAWILERLLDRPDFRWTARGPRDWRSPPEETVATRYAQKARAAGRDCVYLRFVRLPQGAADRSGKGLPSGPGRV